MKPPSLFPDCVLPGCRAPVEHSGDACPGCCTAFGEYLQAATDRPALTAGQIEERDAHVRATYTARHALPSAAGEGCERVPNENRTSAAGSAMSAAPVRDGRTGGSATGVAASGDKSAGEGWFGVWHTPRLNAL